MKVNGKTYEVLRLWRRNTEHTYEVKDEDLKYMDYKNLGISAENNLKFNG